MTLVELVIGMLITALVAAAVAAMLMAVSRGWANSQDIDTQSTITSQAMLRINKIMRDSRQIGAFRAGGLTGSPAHPAAVLIWRSDLNGDNKIQFSELGLIEHEPNGDALNHIPANAIVFWSVQFPSTMTDLEKLTNDSVLAEASLYSDSEIDLFRTGFLLFVKPTVLTVNAPAVQINRIDSQATIRPALEYAMRFQEPDNSATTVKYGRTTLRAAAKLGAGYP
jgi:Tfp pilus assembly protein PilW